METIQIYSWSIIFVKVAEGLSFSAAAKTLDVSKSHISKAIQSLELELGVALLSRSTRKVQLTAMGEEYYRHCARSLETFDEAKQSVVNARNSPRGLLRVSLAGVFGETIIAPIAMQMAKKFPELRIELNFDNRIVDLIQEKFDIAIRIGALPDSNLKGTKIGLRKEFICCSPAYVNNHAKVETPKDLIQHNCLGDQNSWSFKKSGKAQTVPVKGSLKTNNPRVMREAALEGLGIVRLAGSYVFADIAEGRLVPLLEDYNTERKDIWVVHAQKQDQNVNIRMFIQELKRVFKRDYNDVLF